MSVKSVSNDDLISTVEEVYGFALGKSVSTHQLYAFIVGKNGAFEQWELNGSEGSFKGNVIRKHKFSSICEGIVADDFNEKVFVAQEENGIWKMDMNPSKKNVAPKQIVDLNQNVGLTADMEGITMYYADSTNGYLIASVQGNNSYAIFNRQTPHDYVGSFTIAEADGIDGTQETDGLDVDNRAVEGFPNGVLIVQDGYNMQNNELINQNFKLVDWKQIANSFYPPLHVNPDFNKSF